MRVTRILLDLPAHPGDQVTLPAGPSAHLVRVLRLGPGAQLRLADGRGGEYDAELVDADRRGARVRLLGERMPVQRESPLALQLWLGVSRGERMDLAVQKAVELGVQHISPVLTARSVVQLQGERAERRRAHWAEVARSACEQCGRAWRVGVDSPEPLAGLLAERLATDGASTPPGVVLDPRAPVSLAALPHPGAALVLLVGPEGGLDDAELGAAEAAGLRRASLGPRVLRTETAAVAAVCAAQLLWGDLAAG